VLVLDLDGMAFNGNAFFPFEVHIVQDLIHHVTVGYGMGCLQQAVGQGAFSMVYMGDNAKIPDMLHKRFPRVSDEVRN
jgi:hypothetical protein